MGKGGAGDVLPNAIIVHVLELAVVEGVVVVARSAHIKPHGVDVDRPVVLHTHIFTHSDAVGGLEDCRRGRVTVAHSVQPASGGIGAVGDDPFNEDSGVNEAPGSFGDMGHQCIGERDNEHAAGNGSLIMVHIEERVGTGGG